MSYTLYVDVDGVLADFSQQVKNYGLNEANKNEMWKGIRASQGEFWATIPPMDDDIICYWYRMEELIPNIQVLSTPDKRQLEVCVQGKNKWLDQVMAGIPQKRLFVQDKSLYATPTSVLIDDRTDVLTRWKSNGGLGILHENWEDTLDQLEELVLKRAV